MRFSLRLPYSEPGVAVRNARIHRVDLLLRLIRRSLFALDLVGAIAPSASLFRICDLGIEQPRRSQDAGDAAGCDNQVLECSPEAAQATVREINARTSSATPVALSASDGNFFVNTPPALAAPPNSAVMRECQHPL